MVTDSEGERRLPDLPQLESARVNLATGIGTHLPRYWGVIVNASVAWLLLTMLGGMMWGVVVYWPFLDQVRLGRPVAFFGLIMPPLVVIWLAHRLLFANSRWKTSPDGLVVSSALRTRFIAWSDIRNAAIQQSTVYRSGFVEMQTTRDRLKLSLHSPGLHTAASVWQHLRRQGRLADRDVPEAALSFWDIIPEAPDELSWENPSRSTWKLNAAVCLAMAVGFAAGAVAAFFLHWILALVALPLFASGSAIMLAEAYSSLDTALEIGLEKDGFSAKSARGRVAGAWTDVVETHLDTMALSFRLRSGRDRVNIPLRQGDEQNEKLALAVIRAVREAGGPLTRLPDRLRAFLPPSADVDYVSKVELRLGKPEGIFYIGVPLGFALAFMYAALFDPGTSATAACAFAALLLALAVLAFVSVIRYRVTADQTGFTKRNVWGQRQIAWRQVAKAEFCRSSQRQQNYSWMKLTDFEGKVTVNEQFWIGPPADRDRLVAMVSAMLAQCSPQSLQNQSWLARPWTAGP